MANLYLVEDLSRAEAGDTIALPDAEARHAATVARIRVGESTQVGDGRGRVAGARVVVAGRDGVSVRIDAVRQVPAAVPRITLVQALAKAGRDELAAQTAVELGVAAVAPWQAARSVTRWTGDKVTRGEARWAAILREAGKQAMRAWQPEALPLQSTADLLRRASEGLVVVLDPDATTRLVDAVPADLVGDLTLIVGPEGGLEPSELASLEAAGAVRARLGAEVLRTSTAGPAALAALAVHLHRW